MHTVVETPTYLKRAAQVGLLEEERSDIVEHLAANPDAGDKIPGTGGCRKLRWAGNSGGKSKGYRIITFFSGPDIPVFLLFVFAKNEKDNLSKAQQSDLKKATDVLKALAHRRDR